MNNKMLHMVVIFLLIVGGLNWLAVGLFQVNVVDMALASMPIVARAIYVLVGIAAVYEIFMHKRNCAECGSATKTAAPAPGQNM